MQVKNLGRRTMGTNGKFQIRASAPIRTVSAAAARPTVTQQQAKANFGGFSLPQNTNIKSFAKPTMAPIGAGLVPDDPSAQIQLAREIFMEDPISGSVVDIMSMIPFGDFALSGIASDRLKPYEKSLERLRIKSLLPAMTATFLTDGAFLGSLIYNDKDRMFDGIVPQDMQNAQLTNVPFFGASPLIDMRMSPDIARALGNQDPRMLRYMRHLPPEMRLGGLLKLQPENTMYIPRRTRADVPIGTSLFRRIMPVYILEKALLRGTIEMAYRRQRGIIHILVGDENWDASQDELNEVSNLFLAADLDPLGAVIATRTGIQPTEVAGAGDFWRWTDNVDVITQVKLKGLGMPDGLLGGDMSLDSVGQTLTVFIQQTRFLRDYITRSALYEKIFAYIAVTNNHRKDEFYTESARDNAPYYRDRMARAFIDCYPAYAADTDIEMGDFGTPTVTWHNQMRPEGDEAYMQTLNELEQAGVPIPIRMRVAAGGINIQDIINGADDDIKLQKEIKDYKDKLASFIGEPSQFNENALEAAYAQFDPVRAFATSRPQNLLTRKWTDEFDPINEVNGHLYHATGRFKRDAHEKANRQTATASSMIATRYNRLMRSETISMERDPFGGLFGK